jgi:hypothetical protein
MSLTANLGYGGNTDGYMNSSFGTSVRYSVNMGTGKSIGMSYKFGESRNNGNPNVDQYISFSYSVAKASRFNTNLSTSYDLRKGRIGTIATMLNYEMNKNTTLWTDLIYDMETSRFSVKNYNLRYNLQGSMITTNWLIESNDFSIDFSSKFN